MLAIGYFCFKYLLVLFFLNAAHFPATSGKKLLACFSYYYSLYISTLLAAKIHSGMTVLQLHYENLRGVKSRY